VGFRVGEKVVYPNHGVGVIEKISTQQIDGELSKFYLLRLNLTNSIVMVPISNATEVGLRHLISLADCEYLLKNLAENFSNPPSDWKDRYREFVNMMRTGDIYNVARVLKTLTYLNQLKPLSFREKRMLERARYLVISEIATVCKMTESQVVVLVDQALKKACYKHHRGSGMRSAAVAGR